jgi:hypothetical protein
MPLTWAAAMDVPEQDVAGKNCVKFEADVQVLYVC